MAFNTAVFTAQVDLVALIQASALTAAGWVIDRGFPTARPGEKQIWVDEKVSDWTQEPLTTGNAMNQEDFRLDIYVYYRHTTTSPAVIAEAVQGVANVISGIVGSAPFLGGSVAYAYFAGGEYDGQLADSQGRQREGALRISIACIAYPSAA